MPQKAARKLGLYPVYNAQTGNPFLEDRFGYTLLAHTDLSRSSGQAGDIDLANFNWLNFDVVVIDESHNFRNESKARLDEGGRIRHSRYSRLLEEVIKAGTQTKVLMLSATPVNTSLIDLRNQIYLMTESARMCFGKSGIGHIGTLLGQGRKGSSRHGRRKQRRAAEKTRRRYWRRWVLIFSSCWVAFPLLARGGRSSSSTLRKWTERPIPTRQQPNNRYPLTDLEDELSYKNLSEQIERFALSIYRPQAMLPARRPRSGWWTKRNNCGLIRQIESVSSSA